ncbi:NIPSNAP family protein [Variovorax sp. ZT5P49]|uniref:NIPSNAP family protein n=1 Tax=Variovorax sp. ZT5P49 TaxID=3443733 RepID=UPI003F45BDD1
MIFELRSYVLRPGSVAKTLRRFQEVLPHRLAFSTMAGLWATRSGNLDQIFHLWPYASVQERMDVRAAAAASGVWPPKIRDFMVEADSWIVVPHASAPPIVPRQVGSCYEICIDHYVPGGIEEMLPEWLEKVQTRAELASLVTYGRTEIGSLYQWVHIWAYESVVQRERVMDELEATGQWPLVAGRDKLLKRQSTLVKPVGFSPLR